MAWLVQFIAFGFIVHLVHLAWIGNWHASHGFSLALKWVTTEWDKIFLGRLDGVPAAGIAPCAVRTTPYHAVCGRYVYLFCLILKLQGC